MQFFCCFRHCVHLSAKSCAPFRRFLSGLEAWLSHSADSDFGLAMSVSHKSNQQRSLEKNMNGYHKQDKGQGGDENQVSVFPPMTLAACTAFIFCVHPGAGTSLRTVRTSSDA